MITVVDRDDQSIVQKVVSPKGSARYQVVRKASIGDSAFVTVCSSLAEARLLIGKRQDGKLFVLAKEVN